eukprot:GHVQ01016956.1.p1 GENE.GHVQ01016956.1~~GHVQ01016956.1.p1  ORF type:complete len:207 (+),score=29.71 GHVQ01016956.1:659-1279(+)
MGDLMEYNGSAIVAMAGKGCVGIACDKRLGINRFQTVSSDFQKIYKMNDKCFLGLAGLATDVQTVAQYMQFRRNLYELREERGMKAQVVSNLVGSVLYSRRFAPFFVAPVVAGLDEKNNPVLTAFDFIGADCKAKDFVVNGTCSEQLYGVCESFWKPDMDEEQLFETLSQCLMAGLDRDCVSGWGGIVHVITPTRIISRTLKGRMD